MASDKFEEFQILLQIKLLNLENWLKTSQVKNKQTNQAFFFLIYLFFMKLAPVKSHP